MKYHFKIHKEGKGYWTECVELSGCLTQGDSKSELLKNMEEALNLYLSEDEDSEVFFPLPRRQVKGRNIVAVAVYPEVAFAMQLRRIRHKRKITQKAMMEILGIRTLSNYQRLEDPTRANPELKTLAFVCRKLPEFEVRLVVGE